MKAFVRINKRTGKLVKKSLKMRRTKPLNGCWKEIPIATSFVCIPVDADVINDELNAEVAQLLLDKAGLALVFLGVGGSEYVTDLTAKTIDVLVPSGTDVEALIASFVAYPFATSVKIGDDIQESGVTPNDFTSDVTYAILCKDGTTTVNWVISVTIAS